ncbi:hypothetical protein [Mycobacterium sp. AZCC_0083]|uniref:hypothetical protein n=1 Tax=Mycobacterium sp. AZCC_0083 TaxID=2735882 RepID=UPI00161462A7|nr:hypothetical protein [Mycobacterium sp. AZCC_0083]MBB5162492.1 hypothetical protein [Mycobacterium sp. AZCC_0083]
MNTTQTTTAPVNLDAPTSSGDRCNPTTSNDEKGISIMPQTTDETGLVQCANCGRYGWHTSDRCPYLNITPPAGADTVDIWEGEPASRVIFGVDRTVTDHAVRVYASVVQLADGTIDDGAVDTDGPHVWVADGERSGLGALNSDQARELAAVLLEAAAEVDGWTAR